MTDSMRATADDAGCWLDGARGWRVAGDAVELAVAYGFELDDDDRAILAAFTDGETEIRLRGETFDPVGYVIDPAGLADTAVAYLDRVVAPAGYGFVWRDGELFLECLHESADYGDEMCETCGEELID